MTDGLSALDELAPALAAFQAEMPVIPNTERARIRTNSGEGYAYSYADLGTIVPIVMPLLAKHGLSFTAVPHRQMDGTALLLGLLLHRSGQHLGGELPIMGRTPQEIGSSLTYGRRYLLCCMTGIVTDDDDDGQLAQRAAQTRSGLAGAASSDEQTHARKGGNPAGSSAERPSEQRAPVDPRHDSSPLNTSSKLAKAMYAGIREAGIERDKVHEFMSEVVGRDITSSKELTTAEATRVLDYLPERVPVAPEEQP